MNQEIKITKKMTIFEVIQKYPKTAFVFTHYGLHCFFCPMANKEFSETIEEVAKRHKVNLREFLQKLNQAAD